MIYVGIDPGINGGMSAITCGELRQFPWRGVEQFRQDVFELSMEAGRIGQKLHVVVEKVHSSPLMGVSSAFTFGENFGMIQGVLSSANVKYELAPAAVWQKALGQLSGGDKALLKHVAEKTFPGGKFTLKTCDSALIAEYARRRFWDGERR